MRTLDDTPIDPEIAAELDAIDATLAGEPVDPKYAGVAELALLLVADRPAPGREFLASLDATVESRFAAAPRAGRGLWQRVWSLGTMPVFGTVAAGLAAAVVAVVVLTSGGSGQRPVVDALNLSPSLTSPGVRLPSPGAARRIGKPAVNGPLLKSAQPKRTPAFGAAGSATASATTAAPTPSPSSSSSSGASASSGAASTSAASTAAPPSPRHSAVNGPSKAQSLAAAPAPPGSSAPEASASPAPQPNGRKIVQSAQIALSTRPNRIDDVSQEVFNVVGRENGIVERSSVTSSGAPNSYAQFQLSIPSGNLTVTLNQLSRLQYAHVASRSDSTQDINHAFVSARSTLTEQQALRTSLLKQLAAAYTTQAVDAIKARLHGVDLKIAALQAQLRNLNHRVAYSQVQVTINGSQPPAPTHRHHSSGGGLTLGRALHDARRVLTVVAGVALISLAVLLPVGLLATLAGWIGFGLRRRRREHALDLA